MSEFRAEFRASAGNSVSLDVHGLSIVLPPLVAKVQPLISHLSYILSSGMKLKSHFWNNDVASKHHNTYRDGALLWQSTTTRRQNRVLKHASAELDPPSTMTVSMYCQSWPPKLHDMWTSSGQPCPR